MPNKALIEQLIHQTKGRLIVMNEEDDYFSKEDRILLKDKIKEGRLRMSSAESENNSLRPFDAPRQIQPRSSYPDVSGYGVRLAGRG